jgi:hypothetical protein
MPVEDPFEIARRVTLERCMSEAQGYIAARLNYGGASPEQLVVDAWRDYVMPRNLGIWLPDFAEFSARLQGGTRPPKHSSMGGAETLERNATGKDAGRATPTPRFPKHACWLADRLRERSWNKHDLPRRGGPDNKTVQKILNGQKVREDVLDKVATALSKAPPSKRLPTVTPLDIPRD